MTTTGTLAALTRAILDEPADDFHRLAYADLCEETGDVARAEFIRLQLRLAEMRRDPSRPTDAATLAGWQIGYHREMIAIAAIIGDGRKCECEVCLDKRANALLKQHAEAWQPSQRMTFIWRRGFVVYASADISVWTLRGPELCRCQPVEAVTVPQRLPRNRAELLQYHGETCRWRAGQIDAIIHHVYLVDVNWSGADPGRRWQFEPAVDSVHRSLDMADYCRRACELVDYPTQDAAVRAFCQATLDWAKQYKGV